MGNGELRAEERPCDWKGHHDHETPKMVLARRLGEDVEVLRLNCKGARCFVWRCRYCTRSCSFAGPCACWTPILGMSVGEVEAAFAIGTTQASAVLSETQA